MSVTSTPPPTSGDFPAIVNWLNLLLKSLKNFIIPSTNGTSGQLEQSNGTATPGWTTSTYPAGSVAAGLVIISDGTNFVASTPAFPNTSATALKWIRSDGTNWIASTATLAEGAVTAGKALISNGTNWVASTPTFPNASATALKIIRSDGTNWIASTVTYPDAAPASGTFITGNGSNFITSTAKIPNAVTLGDIWYGSATSTISALATSATATRYLSNTGVSNIPAWAQINLTNGVTGALPLANMDTSSSTANHVLMSGASAAPTWSSPTYPNAASPTTRKIIVADGTNWTASTETYATPGSSGNLLTSDGTNWTSAPAPASGNWTLVTSTTASTSANVVFSGLVAAKAYAVVITNAVPATNAVTFSMTFNAIATNYWWYGLGCDQAVGLVQGNNGAATVAQIALLGPSNNITIANTANAGASMTIWLPGIGNSAQQHCYWNGFYVSTNANPGIQISGGGYNTGTTAITSLTFAMSSGNISTGVFNLYKLT